MTIRLRKSSGRGGHEWNGVSCVRVMGLCLLVALPAVVAQEVVAPSPAAPMLPPALREYQAEKTTALPSIGAISDVTQEPSPFQWGPVTLQPRVSYRFLYGDGIQATPGDRSKTAIHEIAPGLRFGLGSHWILDYTPTWTFYSNKNFRDNLGHAVGLTGGGVYGDWVLGLSQSYGCSDTPLIETGRQTSQETFSTALTASHRFSPELSLDLSLNQNLRFVEAFAGSREWSTMDWLNYQVWPRFTVAVGAGFGYVDVDRSPDETYEQYQGRISWRATDKISLQIHGGVEDRQFVSGGAGDLVNPIFGASVQYQPFEATGLSFSAKRAVNASFFQDEVTETTSLSATLSQRLLGKLMLSLGGGHSTVRYVAATSSVSAGRHDDNYSFDARLASPFLKRGSVEVFYQYADNVSNEPAFSYTSHQVGIQVQYRF